MRRPVAHRTLLKVMSRSRSAGAVVLLAVLALSGCSSAAGVATSTPAPTSTVPLTVASSPSSADGLIGWPGAAGGAVRCDGPVVGTTRGAPYDGEDTGTTPEAALEAGRRWARWSGAQTGFSFAREADGRRLYLLEVDGVAKQALILRHGPALKGDGSRRTVLRWWLESWARCDFAELPDSVARENGLQLWTGVDGKRQTTSAVVSFDFSGGCFPNMTALDIGGPVHGSRNDERRIPTEYVRNPDPDLRSSYFTAPYLAHVAVPADARDTGYERAGRHLWIAEDRGYAYVGSATDAEAWPRAKRPIRCA